MSDLWDDVEKKGRGTMKLRKLFLLSGTVALAGCAHVDPNPAFHELANTVHLRTGKRVQWNRGSAQDAEAQAAVASLLSRPLTAGSAVQVALLNNHRLQATYEELGIAQADLVEAGLLRNPIFTFERRFPGQALEMDVLKEFIDILLLPLRKRIAAAQFEATKLRVAHEVLVTAAEVRAAFHEHQGDQQLVDLRNTVAAATERSAEAALRMHEAGNLKNLDLATEQASHAQAKIELAKAQSEATQSREKLNKLMGAFGEQTNWTVASRLPDLPGEEVSISQLESRAIQQRLDLAAARQEFIAQARSLGIARADAILERAEIGAHYEREISGEYAIGPSVNVPIPIFNQGQPAFARASAKLRQGQQRYLALATDIRSDVRAARDRMLLARQQVEYFKSTALPTRTRVTEESQLEYNAMQIGPLQLLQAKQDEVKTGADSVEALRDYWVARAELEKAVGGSLGGKILHIAQSFASGRSNSAAKHSTEASTAR
ncbi:MAG: TolC family protein [Verrucomicrobia bacterium]|nr:MAG: TolC family protein [Verrucomicrobiota bacterium]